MIRGSRIDWFNENEGRAYPVSETATRRDDGGLTLPNDIVVDMGLVLPKAFTGVRISSLYISPQIVAVAVSSDEGGLLVGSYARASVTPYTAYPLQPVTPDCSGWIVFGTYAGTGYEQYRFATPAQSLIETRAFKIVVPPGVTKFYRQGNDAGLYADGVVRLTGSRDVVITVDPMNPHNIIVGLASTESAKYVENCATPASRATTGVPVLRTINNVPADADGQLTIGFE